VVWRRCLRLRLSFAPRRFGSQLFRYLLRVTLIGFVLGLTLGFIIGLVAALFITVAQAQHFHPPQDEPLHEKFYRGWYMPDDPTKSCCNKADCYPTEVRIEGDAIFARRREDGRFIRIPPQKVERHRDNPDGRNHLCAPPPLSIYPNDTVFCFSLGAGI